MDTPINAIVNDPLLMAQKSTQGSKKAMVAEEVESLFIYQLLKAMDQTMNREDDDILYGKGEETFRSLYHQEIAREITRGSGIGLKALIQQEIDQQENK
ncbi:MAG: rod-binding protein [Candidatus Omnitrophica bacterium]|nr:rod-binding protein [Candidatus Omnitrophota bacterium]